ncbi:hypothetical protein CABS01_16586 [Colletotrichum abscissum]|uniref:uncharacterized protein n=1 Tax=Colletotrichum abscissum TaxID=1671311 RepID=UPI0027D655C5|nr:uncharacterized protein CABS01_16586 [Colletotrichum abscissum]KAK1519319.1 hypothetical protein CABS01_16586 [Colletotrichum abscissum]
MEPDGIGPSYQHHAEHFAHSKASASYPRTAVDCASRHDGLGCPTHLEINKVTFPPSRESRAPCLAPFRDFHDRARSGQFLIPDEIPKDRDELRDGQGTPAVLSVPARCPCHAVTIIDGYSLVQGESQNPANMVFHLYRSGIIRLDREANMENAFRPLQEKGYQVYMDENSRQNAEARRCIKFLGAFLRLLAEAYECDMSFFFTTYSNSDGVHVSEAKLKITQALEQLFKTPSWDEAAAIVKPLTHLSWA